jgi:adenylate cyclase
MCIAFSRMGDCACSQTSSCLRTSRHLLNHGLGVVSLALAESGLRLEMAFWRTPIMTILLYGAVAIHFALALWTLYSRRDWRLPGVEALRLAAGFSFPLLLINHAVSTRLGDALFGIVG